MIKKTYFVTGGTSSVGENLIKKISKKENQSAIFFTYFKDVKKKNYIKSKYPNTFPVKLDLGSKKSILKLKNFKYKIDALILCAASTKFIPIQNFKKFKPSDFENITNINLVSQYSVVYYLLDNLKKNSNLVFLSSIASKNSIGSNCAYSASKAAINNLTMFFSRALKAKVTVNSVAPGLMKTKLTKKFSNKYFIEYSKKTNTLKLTTPDMVGDLIYYLISKKRNINGQTLSIDGGCF